jgi:hypothetical protein
MPWKGVVGEGLVEERGWEYRRRPPERTVLYEAVRDNLATLLAEASGVGRGLPRYVERDFARYLECGVLAHGFYAYSGQLEHSFQQGRTPLAAIPSPPAPSALPGFLEGRSRQSWSGLTTTASGPRRMNGEARQMA